MKTKDIKLHIVIWCINMVLRKDSNISKSAHANGIIVMLYSYEF